MKNDFIIIIIILELRIHVMMEKKEECSESWGIKSERKGDGVKHRIIIHPSIHQSIKIENWKLKRKNETVGLKHSMQWVWVPVKATPTQHTKFYIIHFFILLFNLFLIKWRITILYFSSALTFISYRNPNTSGKALHNLRTAAWTPHTVSHTCKSLSHSNNYTQSWIVLGDSWGKIIDFY